MMNEKIEVVTGIYDELVMELVKDLDIDLTKPLLKELKGFDNKYVVDVNAGIVYEKEADGKLKRKVANPNDNGYCFIGLSSKEKKYRSYPVSWVVMAANLEMEIGDWKKFGFNEINHKLVGEEYRSLNAWWNLELDTRKGNLSKRQLKETRRVLTKEEVRQLREEFKDITKGKMAWYYAKAKELGVSHSTIQKNMLMECNKDVN